MTIQTGNLDRLHAILDRYELIALVANNETLDIEAVRRTLPENTLFFFFTGCEKILSKPFGGASALCHRLVSETRFLKAPKYFRMAYSLLPAELAVEVGVLADGVSSGVRRHSELTPFVIDFDFEFAGFYPDGYEPTTGFALALYIIEKCPSARVCLCGFSGVAGLRYTVHHGHDWTFEQTLLQLLARSGRVQWAGGTAGRAKTGPLDSIVERYPQFGSETVALVTAQVLSSRFNGMERQMAKLWARTRLQRTIGNSWRRLMRTLGIRPAKPGDE